MLLERSVPSTDAVGEETNDVSTTNLKEGMVATRELDPAEAARQIPFLRDRPSYGRLSRPCTAGDGIRVLAKEERPALLRAFDAAVGAGRVGKIVPAAETASRLFQEMETFLAAPPGTAVPAPIRSMLDALPQFAFFEVLAALLRDQGFDPVSMPWQGHERTIVAALVGVGGLEVASLPLGLLPFHRTPGGVRTPFEEHLVEAAALGPDAEGLCRVHFTVAPEHRAAFEELAARLRPNLEARHGCRFALTFSHQQPSRELQHERGKRGASFPLADGALVETLENLGAQGWDLVFLTTIDNVVPDERKELVHRWKRLLGGALVLLQETIFHQIRRLRAMKALAGRAAERTLGEASAFLIRELGRVDAADWSRLGGSERRSRLIAALDRPLRVCGVVRNQGDQEGGPFWVDSPPFGRSLRIVDGQEVDPLDASQVAILRSATHRHAIDLVYGLRDAQGRPFELRRFLDSGATLGWNTVFVEVPGSTWSPVETVFDLLRPEHQPAG